MLGRVGDDQAIDRASRCGYVINDNLKAIACGCDEGNGGRVQLGGRDACCAASLNGRTLLDGFGAAVNGHPFIDVGGAHKQNDLRWPWKVFVLPPADRIETKLIRG